MLQNSKTESQPLKKKIVLKKKKSKVSKPDSLTVKSQSTDLPVLKSDPCLDDSSKQSAVPFDTIVSEIKENAPPRRGRGRPRKETAQGAETTPSFTGSESTDATLSGVTPASQAFDIP